MADVKEWAKLVATAEDGPRVRSTFNMWNFFGRQFRLEHYKGWTIWTLVDQFDNDYSVVARKGEFTSPAEFARAMVPSPPPGGAPPPWEGLEEANAGGQSASHSTREEAVAWGKKFIDDWKEGP